jgi:predicted nucleotidyltransferase
MGDDDLVLMKFSPNKESLHQRYMVYKLLKSSIYRALEKKLIKVTVYGSLPLRTFLEEGDIDITVITTPEDAVFPEVVLEKVKGQLLKDFEISKLDLVMCEVPLLKLQVFFINIDISINQIGGVRSLIFLEDISRLYPKHLLKKSIVICKAWGTYYSRILGSQMGLLGSYALEVLIVFIINSFPECRSSPLEVLKTLLQYFSEFDWENWIVTCIGVIPRLKWTGDECELTGRLPLSAEKLKIFRDELKSTQTSWVHRFVNIADPVFPGNNLGKRIELAQFLRMKQCFKVASDIVREFGVLRLFCKYRPQVAVENLPVLDLNKEKNGTAVSFFANGKKLRSALESCLAVMDPSFPQNY